MTKKSQARLQRDATNKQAQSQGIEGVYDNLNFMFEKQWGLFEQYRKMIEIITHEAVAPFLKDQATVDVLLKGFDADIGQLLDKTKATYALHRGKTGFQKPDDEDEHFLTMQLQQDYMVYMGVHQQVLIPVMMELDEHMRGALTERKRLEDQAAAAAAALDSQPLVQVPAESEIGVEANTAPAVATAASYEQPALDAQ
jgi:hypothetical protein